ncbi:HipA domain-containing protein [Arthrobacter humicola]|uniref:HipA domain-containing protein n=1 Tax=Arthrobacter humicola TaxID=409291 RepID=A0ABN2ZE58_9MICC
MVEIQKPDGIWESVGYLRSQNDTNWYESKPEYWRLANRPVLGQIFEEKGEHWSPRATAAIPRWFSHLLPEGILRLETAAAAQINPVREFQLLARLGADDLPGAVRATLLSEDGEHKVPELSISPDEDEELQPLLKFSLAGVQLKFSVATTDRGPTVPVSGKSGDAILKMPDGRSDFGGVPEAEFAAMTLAKLVGLNVAPVSLVDASNIQGLGRWSSKLPGNSLLIERYDRLPNGQRVHAEELAQVLDIPTARINAKYSNANFESIANYISKIVGVDVVGEVIDRIVFNIMIGNGDAHLKNWSLIYPDGRIPALSPAYDIVPTVLYLPKDDLGLNLNGTKEFAAINAESFERLGGATGFGYKEARIRAKEMVHRILDSWKSLNDLLPSEQFRKLDSRLGELSLLN